MITEDNFLSIMGASPDRTIRFTDGTKIYITSQGYFLANKFPMKIKEAIAHAVGRPPICFWCLYSSMRPAIHVMPDGLLLCAECHSMAKGYYVCSVCGTDLPADLASYARQRYERYTCGKKECKKAEDVRHGRLCCMEAEDVPCVCYRSYKCSVHHPNGVHVGTHD